MKRTCVPIFVVLAGLCSAGCGSTAMEHWMVGQLELKQGNTVAAIEHLEESKRRDPLFAPAYLALAAAFSRLGNAPAVADNLSIYLALNPDHATAHLYLAECLLTLGHEDLAKEEFLAFVHQAPLNTERNPPRLRHAYCRLAEIAHRSDDPFEENLYAGAAYFCAARVRESAKNSDKPAEAKPTETAAKQGDKTIVPVSATVAKMEEPPKTGRDAYAEALQRFRSAKTLRPNDPVVRRWVQETLRELGEPAEVLTPPAPRAAGSVEKTPAEPTASTPNQGLKRVEKLVLEQPPKR